MLKLAVKYKRLGRGGVEEVKKIVNSDLPIYALDVNSKFESEPGVKKIEEIKKFKKSLTV
jgi:phosphoribosylanthranilate isomerase